MKLRKLFVQNLRCFEKLEIDFDPRLTVIVAENGAGKTTVLDAIAVGFGRLLTKLPGVSGITSKESDIRINQNEKQSPFLLYWLQAEASDSKKLIEWSGGRKRDSSPKTAVQIKENIDHNKASVSLKQIDAYTNDLVDSENDGKAYVMPVIAYYGTNRALMEEVKRRRNFKKEFRRFDALAGALEPNARFKTAFEWFNAMEDVERRRKEEQRDFNYRLPELEAVRLAIQTVLGGFHNPRTEIGPLRFVIDRTMSDGTTKTFRITQLSDGYRVMLGLVIDLARRMEQANPHLVKGGMTIANPLDLPAIVLIDEVDLHLHPKWQQRVIADLQRTFRGAQFIITTHSPQVLTTVPASCIRIIENGAVHAAPPGTEGAEASRLLKRVLGVDVRPPDSDATRELSEYLALVDADLWDSDRARELRQKLDARYQGEEPALIDADLRIENRKWELNK